MQRDSNRDMFLLLASDGVWDFLTPDQVRWAPLDVFRITQAVDVARATFGTSPNESTLR